MKISKEYYDLVDAGFAVIIERLNLRPGQWGEATPPRVFAWAWLGLIFTDLQYDDQHPTYKQRKRIVPQRAGFKPYANDVKDAHWDTVLRKIIQCRLNIDMDHPPATVTPVASITIEAAAASLVNTQLYAMAAGLASATTSNYYQYLTVHDEPPPAEKLEKVRKLFAAHLSVVRDYLGAAIRADVTPRVLLELLDVQEQQDAAARPT